MSDARTLARHLVLHTVAIASIGLLTLSLAGCSQEQEQLPQTLDELRAEAEAGDAGSQWALGSRYEMGVDVPQDTAEAAAWYCKAAASYSFVDDYVSECAELSETASLSKWLIRSSTNPLDDSVTLSVHRDADSDSGVGRFGVEAASLIARCRSNTTDAYIAWGKFMSTDDSFVTVRTTGDAYSEFWGVSTDYDMTFAPHPIPLLREVVEADRVVMHATPYGETPRTLIWELDADDTRQAIEQVAEACNWELPAPTE